MKSLETPDGWGHYCVWSSRTCIAHRLIALGCQNKVL